MLKECGQQLFCSLAVAANNMTSDLVWLHIFANPRRWTYFTTWKIQKSGPQRKQRKQRKHLVAIHGLALHTVSHVINEAHRPSLADFADFAVHILQLLQLTHINHSSSKHKAQSTRKAQGRQEFDIDRFDRSIDMVWHSQYVQYVSVCHSTGKCPKCVTYEICSKHVPNMFHTCSKHVPNMSRILFKDNSGFEGANLLPFLPFAWPAKSATATSTSAPLTCQDGAMWELQFRDVRDDSHVVFFARFHGPKTTMRVASKRNAQNAQRFWDGQSSNLYHVYHVKVKVIIPWVWPPWGPLMDLFISCIAHILRDVRRTHLHLPVPIFFLSSMNREDRLIEPAEHLFRCNGFNPTPVIFYSLY